MFVIIGQKDQILYETSVGSSKQDQNNILKYFSIHSQLDNFQEIALTSNNMYLKSLEKDSNVYGFLTASGLKLMILVEKIEDEKIQKFFVEVYKLIIQNIMNPLYQLNSMIQSSQFDQKVKLISQKFFP